MRSSDWVAFQRDLIVEVKGAPPKHWCLSTRLHYLTIQKNEILIKLGYQNYTHMKYLFRI
jgi:hypothetical protein